MYTSVSCGLLKFQANRLNINSTHTGEFFDIFAITFCVTWPNGDGARLVIERSRVLV